MKSVAVRPATSRPAAWLPVAVLALSLSGVTSLAEAGDAVAEGGTEAAYALDSIERVVNAKGRVRCPEVELIRYRGDVIRYHSKVRVHPAFAERLARFEEVVRDVGVEVFGRAPRRIRHIGGYVCRRIAAWPELLSEHGLGNAIDIRSFEFPRLPKGTEAPPGLPRRLRRSFSVDVGPASEDLAAETTVHGARARFLRTLSARLAARVDRSSLHGGGRAGVANAEPIFRVLLGPAYPGHKAHFHFDMAPYPLVDLYEGLAPDPS